MKSVDRNVISAAVLGGAALLVASFASAAAPVNPWTVRVSPGRCGLERTYAEPIGATFSLETDAGSGDYSLSIAKRGLERLQIGWPEKAVLKIDGRVQARTFVTIFSSDNSFSRLANIAGLSDDAVNAMSAGREFTIQGDTVKVGPLPLPEVTQAIAALRHCEAEQLIEWGADPAQFARGGRQPQVRDRMDLIPQSKLRRIRYPDGPVDLLHYVVIDANGVVEHCASVFGEAKSDFERAVCSAVLGRKIGTPARDPAGKAVRGVVSFTPALLIRQRITRQ